MNKSTQQKSSNTTKITLKFKKSDFTDTSYVNSNDCAITRALARAGYPNLMDVGGEIINKKNLTRERHICGDNENEDNTGYKQLLEKVLRNYGLDYDSYVSAKQQEIKPFQATLTVPTNRL